ncbi:MAG TPA: type II secretion system F family protein [Candidatus Hydrogenedentes bacterium]|nr:type II secretion system F family protein [Candidatus Hydrogenedentota bacterium]HOS02717.1 type II secretion system F family protein [Candidatus Hydrogenedentota bacterium]
MLPLQKRLSTKQLCVLLHELQIAYEAGIPLVRCFRVIARRARQPIREMCEFIADGLQRGHTLGDMIRAESKRFPRHYGPAITCAERSGTLLETFRMLSKEAHEKLAWIHLLVKAVTYPAAVCFAAFILIPYVKGLVLTGFSGEDLLRFTVRFASGVISILVFPLAVFLGGRSLLRIGAVARLAEAAMQLRWFPYGTTRRKLAMSRQLHIMGLLMNAGMDAPKSILAAAEITGNPVTQDRAKRAAAFMQQGCGLAEAGARSGLFSGTALAMLAVGETAGETGDILIHFAKLLRNEATHTIVISLALLEPTLILLIGLLIVSPFAATLLAL